MPRSIAAWVAWRGVAQAAGRGGRFTESVVLNCACFGSYFRSYYESEGAEAAEVEARACDIVASCLILGVSLSVARSLLQCCFSSVSLSSMSRVRAKEPGPNQDSDGSVQSVVSALARPWV